MAGKEAAYVEGQKIIAATGVTTAQEGVNHTDFKVDPLAIEDVKVMETFKAGQSSYRAN